MFDKYFVRGGPEVISAVSTTHEHRAPTDESVRLLREMEEKTLSSIIEKTTLKNNLMEITYFILKPEYHIYSYYLVIAFKLNGEVIKIETELDERTYIKMSSMEELGAFVMAKVSEKLTKILFRNMDSETVRQFDKMVNGRRYLRN